MTLAFFVSQKGRKQPPGGEHLIVWIKLQETLKTIRDSTRQIQHFLVILPRTSIYKTTNIQIHFLQLILGSEINGNVAIFYHKVVIEIIF